MWQVLPGTSTFYTLRTTTTTTEGRQVCVCGGEAKPHGFALRRRLAHCTNIKGDIIVSGATSTIIQLATLYSPYHTTTTALSGKTHLQTSAWRHHSQSRKVLLLLIWASLVRPDLQFTAKDHTRHLASPTEWDWSLLKHTLRYIKGHFITSSSSHLDYLKDIRYHFDNLSRCTSTPTVTQTGPQTSNRGSLPRAQSHQYLE